MSSVRAYWSYRVGQAALTLVLIPGVLWLASIFWQRVEQDRVDHEELERAQTDLLDALTERMEGLVALRSDLWKATTTLAGGCPSDGPRDVAQTRMAVAACVKHYVTAMDALDQAIVDLAWRIDSLPIVSPGTYTVLTAFKTTYWKSCADDAPAAECGYRQRAVRLVHGIGLGPGEGALKFCSSDGEPGCKNSSAVMKASVQAPVNLDVNTFFCMLVSDIKNVRVITLRRRSEAIGGDATFDALIDRLDRNLQSSACTTIIEQWKTARPTSA
jgi:hypothetical protein